MQPAKTPCSDLGARRGPLLVLEGMPGTGKTTTATRLEAEGQQVQHRQGRVVRPVTWSRLAPAWPLGSLGFDRERRGPDERHQPVSPTGQAIMTASVKRGDSVSGCQPEAPGTDSRLSVAGPAALATEPSVVEPSPVEPNTVGPNTVGPRATVPSPATPVALSSARRDSADGGVGGAAPSPPAELPTSPASSTPSATAAHATARGGTRPAGSVELAPNTARTCEAPARDCEVSVAAVKPGADRAVVRCALSEAYRVLPPAGSPPAGTTTPPPLPPPHRAVGDQTPNRPAVHSRRARIRLTAPGNSVAPPGAPAAVRAPRRQSVDSVLGRDRFRWCQ
jgi:hypothetical protein